MCLLLIYRLLQHDLLEFLRFVTLFHLNGLPATGLIIATAALAILLEIVDKLGNVLHEKLLFALKNVFNVLYH